jgi:hypothetical protein
MNQTAPDRDTSEGLVFEECELLRQLRGLQIVEYQRHAASRIRIMSTSAQRSANACAATCRRLTDRHVAQPVVRRSSHTHTHTHIHEIISIECSADNAMDAFFSRELGNGLEIRDRPSNMHGTLVHVSVRTKISPVEQRLFDPSTRDENSRLVHGPLLAGANSNLKHLICQFSRLGFNARQNLPEDQMC